MWRHAGDKPDALRQLKQVHKGDRALCYHGKPDHAIYALAEVSRAPYPIPTIKNPSWWLSICERLNGCRAK